MSSFHVIKTLSKSTLVNLLKEVWNISSSDVPSQVTQSMVMKHLFGLEKTDYNNWGDQYMNVRMSIEIEILNRIRNDKWDNED